MPGHGNWKRRLGGHCARWTVTRQAVLDLLSRRQEHWSARDIYVSLHDSCPGIGMTTVYRTLDLLERTGFVRRITLGDGQARYEFKPPDKTGHHHHLVCTGCGKIVDYSDFAQEELELVRKTENALAKKHDFRISDHHIEFLGLCGKCRADEAETSR